MTGGAPGSPHSLSNVAHGPDPHPPLLPASTRLPSLPAEWRPQLPCQPLARQSVVWSKSSGEVRTAPLSGVMCSLCSSQVGHGSSSKKTGLELPEGGRAGIAVHREETHVVRRRVIRQKLVLGDDVRMTAGMDHTMGMAVHLEMW